MNKLFVFLWILVISIGAFINRSIPTEYKYMYGFTVGVVAQVFCSVAFRR